MHLVISSGNSRYEAVLLAVSKDRLRIARPGHVDTIELTALDGAWVGENGMPVEFEAFLMDNNLCVPELLARAFPLTRTARIA